jgi:3-oxoadipate enol-lactonase
MIPPVDVAYEVRGTPDGPVVLLANSLGCTSLVWDGVMPALERWFRVIRFDLRGHGRSPVPPGPYTIADFGADVVALLDRLEVPRANVAGLSIGGMAALWLAANVPERVARLAILCSSARLGPASYWAARAETVLGEGIGEIADAVVGRWLTPDYAASHPELMARLRAMLVAQPVDGYVASCRAIERMDLVADLERIAADTLVLAAAGDLAIPVDHARVIAAGIPHARLAIVDDAAHLASLERPAEVAELLIDHFSRGRPEERP